MSAMSSRAQDLSLAILEGREDDFQSLLRERKWPTRALNESLLSAATKGNARAFRQLLDAGAKVSAKNPIKRSVLHLVARRGGGDADITRMTLEAAGDVPNFVNQKDKAGLTPLYYASKSGHAGCVRVLIDGEASLDQSNCFGKETALMAAAERGHVEIVCMLVEAGCRVDKTDTCGYTALVRAASRGQTATVRELLAKSPIDPKKDKQLVPVALNLAATYGGIETLQAILETDVDLNQPDLNGTTALSHAATRNRLDIVKFLMSKGADVNVAVAPMGIVPLAATLPKMCRDFLHSRGKSNPSSSEVPFTAVHQAASMGSAECLEYMLEHGHCRDFTLDVCDSRGRTLLAKACSRLCYDVVRVLLKHGADPNFTGPDGATPLGLVVSIHTGLFFRCDYPCQMVRDLIRNGSNVDVKACSTFEKFGCRSLFHAALQNRLVCIAKMLWVAGCDPNIGALSDPPPEMDDRHIKDTESFLQEVQLAGRQSLAVLARRAIREHLGRQASKLISDLPVPDLIKQYLQIPELGEIEADYDGVISLNNDEGEEDPDFEFEDEDSLSDSDLSDSSWGDVSYTSEQSTDDEEDAAA